MAVRALLIYAVAIALVRLGEKRFMGKNTALDMILGVVLGSVLSRAITGNAPFVPTIIAAGMLVALHAIFSAGAFHLPWFGRLVKGHGRTLIKDGTILWDQMRKSHITQHDLDHALRTKGGVTEAKDVQLARLERSGGISVITRSPEKQPKIIDIAVNQGVQTVRIELS